MLFVNHLLSFLRVDELVRLKQLRKCLANNHFSLTRDDARHATRNATTIRLPLLVCGYAPHPHPNTQTKREACETSIPRGVGGWGAIKAATAQYKTVQKRPDRPRARPRGAPNRPTRPKWRPKPVKTVRSAPSQGRVALQTDRQHTKMTAKTAQNRSDRALRTQRSTPN